MRERKQISCGFFKQLISKSSTYLPDQILISKSS